MHMWAVFSNSAAHNGLTSVPPVTDPSGEFPIVSTNDILLPDWARYIVAHWASSANAARAVLRGPSFKARGVINQELSPISGTSFSVGRPDGHPYVSPIPVQPGTALQALLDNANNAERNTVAVLLADKAPQPVKANDVVTLRFTGTTTVTANAWSTVPLTPDDTLPDGNIKVIGARYQGTSAQLGRLIFAGQKLEPSFPAMQQPGDGDAIRSYRFGGMGELGSFNNRNVPSLRAFCSAADTAQTVLLDCVVTKRS